MEIFLEQDNRETKYSALTLLSILPHTDPWCREGMGAMSESARPRNGTNTGNEGIPSVPEILDAVGFEAGLNAFDEDACSAGAGRLRASTFYPAYKQQLVT